MIQLPRNRSTQPLQLEKTIRSVTYGITGVTALALACLWIGVGPRVGFSFKQSLLGGVVTPLMVGGLGYLVANPSTGLSLPQPNNPSQSLCDRIGEWFIRKLINA